MNKTSFSILLLGVLFFAVLIFAFFPKEQIDFNEDIRPILNKNCLSCHGGVKQQAGLSFLFLEEAFEKLESGNTAIVPGNPSKSAMVERISSKDPEYRMPIERDALDANEIKVLTKWIKQGAKYESHWAYVKPEKRSKLPKPVFDDYENEVDLFVHNVLKEKALKPNPIADKEVLLRRLSLDLIGLPPAKEEMDHFLNDDSEEAYEKLVDRLLNSPHFGERWASMWLDLARYADSKGYQKDNIRREIWRYRDWVIEALNEDMPFDEFTIKQIAGDLLENSTDKDILATAFHRNTMTNDEGGTDNEEYRVAAVIDRVNTSYEIWQGTTMSCVQCHSHPFDPIKHDEFYSSYAFFNNTADQDNDSDDPRKVLYSPAQSEYKDKLSEELSSFQESGDTVSDHYQNTLQEFLSIQPGKVQIMQELPPEKSRQTFVFERGNWLAHGREIDPGTPGFLPKLETDIESNRLGFAKWLVDENNPLTSRVIVNRFWEQIFGNGLVITVEDFGTQGEKPSHPELLDWLSISFQNEYQWSVKSLLKTMVMSSTYRQSSNFTDEKLQIDPYNFLLSRGPRYRLSAEAIRDQALVISGLFNDKVFGPSVKPYQPEGVWNVIRHVDKWEIEEGKEKHRRALYTFWRRVSPYPSMITFDTPSREVCVSRRIRTNTPLQALVTLNDKVFVEASEALAERMITEGGAILEDKIAYGYKLALIKDIDKEKRKILLQLYEKSMNEYQEDYAIDEAKKLAMIVIANTILNLDELIMKV